MISAKRIPSATGGQLTGSNASHPLATQDGSAEEDIPIPNLIAEQGPEYDLKEPVAEHFLQHELPGISQAPTTEHSRHTVAKLLATTAAVIIILFLALLLTAQIALFHKDRLSRQPILAETINRFCEVFGCVNEPVRDLERIEIINRNVISHPTIPNALKISATFANIAPFPQPHPLIQVSLTDLQGKVIATRRFVPREYLNATDDSKDLMPPGHPVTASVEVADPGGGAVAFEFDFY
ncbi:MAG: DUF3426 domain-containing protein [Pseudomonadota bacterium]